MVKRKNGEWRISSYGRGGHTRLQAPFVWIRLTEVHSKCHMGRLRHLSGQGRNDRYSIATLNTCPRAGTGASAAVGVGE